MGLTLTRRVGQTVTIGESTVVRVTEISVAGQTVRIEIGSTGEVPLAAGQVIAVQAEKGGTIEIGEIRRGEVRLKFAFPREVRILRSEAAETSERTRDRDPKLQRVAEAAKFGGYNVHWGRDGGVRISPRREVAGE